MKPITKLHISVIFGWSVLLFSLLDSLQTGEFFTGLILGYIILSIRYSVIKPVELLGAAFAGWVTSTIIEYFAGLRNIGFNPITIGIILLMFLYYFWKGVILSTFFLIRETYQLVVYYMDKKRFNRV